MLKFRPDNVEVVRKDINLDGPGRMDEAVDLLEKWVQMQEHFLKKDFSRQYLETTLVSAKGMVERAKQRIDKLCTLKTLMPEFYPTCVNKEMFASLDSILHHAHLPMMTKEHYRVYVMNMISDNLDSSIVLAYYRYIIVVSEYLKSHDYNKGFSIILDFRNISIMSFITKLSPVDLRHIVTLLTEGYGMRIKRIDLISGSKMIDSLVLFFKQVISKKLGDRIHVHQNLDTIHEVVDKDVLPEDYGGKEMPLRTLNAKWLDTLCSKENVELFLELNKAKTDESCRQMDKFNEHYIGMPGSFRALTVD